MKIGLIGLGAMGRYVLEQLSARGRPPVAVLVRPDRVAQTRAGGARVIGDLSELPGDLDVMVDCAGHAALAELGPSVLERGIRLVTVSVGALADPALHAALERTAGGSGAQLHLASGAIGALDCLRAAQVGGLSEVTYTGRKPPAGWKGSPAGDRLDLDRLTGPAVHFEGSARDAARQYPKNANVAASVALAGPGFDATRVRLIADPTVAANIHEVEARGAFGSFAFRIEGHTLPDTPRTSALAAMSVIAAIERETAPITL